MPKLSHWQQVFFQFIFFFVALFVLLPLWQTIILPSRAAFTGDQSNWFGGLKNSPLRFSPKCGDTPGKT